MDHADVLDRLEEAFLAPTGLAALDADRSEEGVALRRHLDSCETCAREYRAWQTAAAALAAAAPDTLSAPAEARQRVFAAIATTGTPRTGTAKALAPDPGAVAARASEAGLAALPPAPVATPAAQGLTPAVGTTTRRAASLRPSPSTDPLWIAVAAAAAVLLFVLGGFLGGPLGLVPEPSASAPMPSARPQVSILAAAVDRILAEPDHRWATLIATDGRPGGSALVGPASRELVIISTALPPAPAGADYECFVERAGERVWVGRMNIAAGAAFWAGAVDEPEDVGRPGDRLLVILEGDEPSIVLAGAFQGS